MRKRPILMAVLVVAAGLVPAAAAAREPRAVQSASAYSGTHVSFDTASDAVVDYRVNGETVMESVKVQSTSEAGSGIGLGADLGSTVNVDAAGVSLDSRTAVQATVTAESGAKLQAHDNSRGILVVESGGSEQVVTANLSSSSQARQASERTVVVERDGRATGAFLVTGDGQVTVNERGNVTSQLGSDGKLVYRSYPEGRSDEDEKQEELITSGKAAAEVYIVQASDSAEDSGSDGQQRAVDVVHYSESTTVEVTQQSQGRLEMTAERSQSEGKVIITTVSEEAFSSAEDVQVQVDGEAAAEASSYSELEAATEGGDTSRYLVRQSTSAEASADVLVAVNHFSERSVTMTDGSDGGSDDGGSGSDGSDGDDSDDASSGTGPGFGVAAALVALLGAALLGRRL